MEGEGNQHALRPRRQAEEGRQFAVGRQRRRRLRRPRRRRRPVRRRRRRRVFLAAAPEPRRLRGERRDKGLCRLERRQLSENLIKF